MNYWFGPAFTNAQGYEASTKVKRARTLARSKSPVALLGGRTFCLKFAEILYNEPVQNLTRRVVMKFTPSRRILPFQAA
jgi:hypothetical protein